MKPFTPPRFVLRIAWSVHRAIARRGPGRGLWEPGERESWGALTLTTTGRTSGKQRTAIVAFLPDGDRVSILAMNGWQEGHPAWWANLKAYPYATAMRADGSITEVHAHLATGDERERLWRQWTDDQPALEELAANRNTPTDLIVLTHRASTPRQPEDPARSERS